jgi:hypothetical protein
MNNWISAKDKLPENEQEVLTYYYDKPFDIHQIDLLTYYTKGTVIDTKIDRDMSKTKAERLLNTLFNKDFEIKAKEDGFYICEYDENGDTYYRKHADCITHWMPLPEPPIMEV